MIQISEALAYLSHDYLLNASIIEPIRCGSVEILFASDNCVLVKDLSSSVYMLQTEDFSLAERLIEENLPNMQMLVVHNQRLLELAQGKFHFERPVPCFQAVYRGDPFPLLPPEGFEMKRMALDEIDGACEMYGFSRERAEEHILKGLVFAGYEAGKLVAMIGMHLQGSMGLLFIRESSRRKGYAEYMEKFLIDRLLEKNLVPYCQIVEGNFPSLRLQKKLGLEISSSLLYWLHREEK